MRGRARSAPSATVGLAFAVATACSAKESLYAVGGGAPPPGPMEPIGSTSGEGDSGETEPPPQRAPESTWGNENVGACAIPM